MIVVKNERIRYTTPVKKIIKVLFTQIRIPQAIGLTLTNKIPIIIKGTATIANFFQTLNTRSEKISWNNKEAEIKRGV